MWRTVDASTGERDDCDFTAGPPSWLFRVVLLPESALVLAGFKMPLLVIAIFNNYEMTLALVRKIIQTPVLSIVLALTHASHERNPEDTPKFARPPANAQARLTFACWPPASPEARRGDRRQEGRAG